MPHKPSLPKDGANKCVWMSMISVDAKTSSTTGEIWPISSVWAPVEAVTALAGLGNVAFMAKSALDGLDCQHTKNVGRLFATRMSDGRGDTEAINHWRDCQLVKTKVKIQRYLMNRFAHQLLDPLISYWRGWLYRLTLPTARTRIQILQTDGPQRSQVSAQLSLVWAR